MGDEWQEGPESGRPAQEDLDKRIEDIRRKVIESTTEAQLRLKRVVDKAGEYWQKSNLPLQPRQATSGEEDRIRRLANAWSLGNWQLARELGTYMDLVSWTDDEIWEVSVQTRWETRSTEAVAEPYSGRPIGKAEPLLPVWDYELPAVPNLKAPESRVRLSGQDEVFSCTACNGTGRLLCATCSGKGWVVCPDCKGRTRMRCTTCRGRGYIADWQNTKKRTFFQKQADNLTSSVNDKVSNIFDGMREQGVPIGNPVNTDPASKGPTIPCPDCVQGEVDCTCGTGKRVCASCQGSKTELCTHCSGTGKVIRHREIVRRFSFNTQSQFIGATAIPEPRLHKVTGDLVYSAETSEPLYADAAPEGVPMDVWHAAVQVVQEASANPENRSANPREETRASLQVLELTRIPYTKVDYRFSDKDYVFYIYDVEGYEQFFADGYPARWDRIERLVRSITADLTTPAQNAAQANGASDQVRGYRVPVEKPPFSITEEEE